MVEKPAPLPQVRAAISRPTQGLIPCLSPLAQTAENQDTHSPLQQPQPWTPSCLFSIHPSPPSPLPIPSPSTLPPPNSPRLSSQFPYVLFSLLSPLSGTFSHPTPLREMSSFFCVLDSSPNDSTPDSLKSCHLSNLGLLSRCAMGDLHKTPACLWQPSNVFRP